MADPKQLPPPSEEEQPIVVQVGEATYSIRSEERNFTTRLEMAPHTAEALSDIARYEHAIPARERTKRAYVRGGMLGVTLIAVCVFPQQEHAILILAGLAYGSTFIGEIIDRFRPGKTPPEQSDKRDTRD